MNDTDFLQKLVSRLERIAKKNKDEFSYKLGIDVNRTGICSFHFACTETADGHEWLSGCGSTIEEAVQTAWDDIEESCDVFDYTNVV